MSKTIGTSLLAHYQQDSTTLCYLLKIKARDDTVVGITSLNEAVTYDDGAGSVTYNAAIGFDSVSLDASAALDVDNSEASMLLADAGPFSEEKINAGVLDYGEYVVYRINYEDTSLGHEVVDVGTVGIVKKVDGVSGVIELRSLQQQLKQTYGELYSLTCRAKFGSGGGGTCVYRGQCGFDAESLWQNRTVSALGSEADRVFTADTVISATAGTSPDITYSFAPGLVQWLTGDNAGLQSEVESVELAGSSPDATVITLRFGTRYDIQAGDTFKIRPDCDKTWETCRDVFQNQLNFRGEPKIPLADEGAQAVPNYSGIWSPTSAPEAEQP